MRYLNRLFSFALGLVFSLSLHCVAQETPQPTISTDRPSVGTGTDLVPRHWFVSEHGVSLTGSGGTFIVDGPENLLRFGAFNNVELRFAPPNMQRSMNSPLIAGQDASFGAKIRLPAAKAWPLSAVLSLSAPIGSASVTSGGWDPAMMLAASHAWSPRAATSVSANFASISGAGRGREQADQLAASTMWSLSSKATAYVEFAPLLSHDPQISSSTTSSGLTWLVGQRAQFDLRGGAVVNSSGVHPLVGFGYSILFRGFR